MEKKETTAPEVVAPAVAPATQASAPAMVEESYTPTMTADTIKRLPQQLLPISGAFAKPWQAFRKCYEDPAQADRILGREIEFAVQALIQSDYLVKAATRNPDALVAALKNVALTKSTLNPVLKLGYLVPFGNAITFMPSYMGLVDVLVNNGLVKKIEAHAVFEGDEFELSHGADGKLVHKVNPWGKRDAKTLKGCYYYAILTDGTEMYDVMNVEEIDAVMRRSASVGQGKSSPWQTDYIEMAKKTLVRRAFKAIPKTGISEDKLRSIEAVSDYDTKVEQEYYSQQKSAKKKSTFSEEAEYVEVE